MHRSIPVIQTFLIPGIQATALADANTFDRRVIWNAFDSLGASAWTSIMGPSIKEALQQDPRYDERQTSIIERDHVARMPYRPFATALAAKLPDAPLYLFGYDWRMSNLANGEALVKFVHHLLGKLKREKVDRFNIVTHSMGGLVMLCALPEIADHIHKVVLCAPPLRGSPQAYKNMVIGGGGVRGFLSHLGLGDDLRKVARTYPSLYELLPWYENAVRRGDEWRDLSMKGHWQANVYDDIIKLFTERLEGMVTFRSALGADLLRLIGTKLGNRALVHAGRDNQRTLTWLHVSKGSFGTKNYVDLSEDEVILDDGDSTVPLVSATAFSEHVRTFVITRKGLFNEPGNALHFHGLIMQDSRIQNIVCRYLAAVDKEPEDFKRPWWSSLDESVELA